MSDGDAKVQSNGPAAAAPAPAKEPPAAAKPAAAADDAAEPGPGAPRRQGGRRPRQKSEKNQAADDSNIEAEFVKFVTRLRKMNVNSDIVYQINNYKEGVECTFRVGGDTAGSSDFTSNFRSTGSQASPRSKPRKELTPAQLAKIEARREKRRAWNLERKEARQAERAKRKEEKAAAAAAAEPEAAANPAAVSKPAPASVEAAPAAAAAAAVKAE